MPNKTLQCVLGVLLSLAATSHAQPLLPLPAAPEAALVREMLQQDAQRALATEQEMRHVMEQVNAPIVDDVAAATKPMATLSLVGIYGLDKNLTADIQIDGRIHSLRPRQRVMTAEEQHDSSYQLMAINPPCATVRAADNPAQQVCLQMDKVR